jgi:phage terminase large subunit-like protein
MKLKTFIPYPKQLEFFAAGATHDERGLIAANQVGKTEAGAYEAASHLLGTYSSWWPGRKFDHPIRMWIAGTSSENVRNITQSRLLGPYGQPMQSDSGFIPKEAIVRPPTRSRGVSDALDTVWVKWRDRRLDDSAISSVTFKSFPEGRESFQGEPVHVYWGDEEGPFDIYSEARTRLTATKGISFTTLTPMLGQTDLIQWLMDPAATNRHVTNMGLVDAPHFSPEEVARRIADCPEIEREPRIYGHPSAVTGRVFLTPFENIAEDIGPLEEYAPEYRKLVGIDFGIYHPFAAVLVAHDTINDIVHILHTYRVKDATPAIHCAAINQFAPNVRVAWPHDGEAREKSSGESLASMYENPPFGARGLKMLDEHSTWPDGGFSTDRAISEVDARTREGTSNARLTWSTGSSNTSTSGATRKAC